MIEPDVVLPSQLRPRGLATPEKRLMLAVLEEAVGTFQRYVMATDRQSRDLFADVEAWFASEETGWLFSFIGICDALGVDASYVRSGLGQWQGVHLARSLEMEQPRYRFPFRRMNGTRHRTTGRPPGVRKRG